MSNNKEQYSGPMAPAPMSEKEIFNQPKLTYEEVSNTRGKVLSLTNDQKQERANMLEFDKNLDFIDGHDALLLKDGLKEWTNNILNKEYIYKLLNIQGAEQKNDKTEDMIVDLKESIFKNIANLELDKNKSIVPDLNSIMILNRYINNTHTGSEKNGHGILSQIYYHLSERAKTIENKKEEPMLLTHEMITKKEDLNMVEDMFSKLSLAEKRENLLNIFPKDVKERQGWVIEKCGLINKLTEGEFMPIGLLNNDFKINFSNPNKFDQRQFNAIKNWITAINNNREFENKININEVIDNFHDNCVNELNKIIAA